MFITKLVLIILMFMITKLGKIYKSYGFYMTKVGKLSKSMNVIIEHI